MRLCHGVDQRIVSAPIRLYRSPGPAAHTHFHLYRPPFRLLVSSHTLTMDNHIYVLT